MRTVRQRLFLVTGGWIVVVLVVAAYFVAFLFYGESRTVDYPSALDRAAKMQVPGPLNGWQPWSSAQAQAYRRDAARLFWREVWVRGRPYLAMAAVLLAAAYTVVIIAATAAASSGESTLAPEKAKRSAGAANGRGC